MYVNPITSLKGSKKRRGDVRLPGYHEMAFSAVGWVWKHSSGASMHCFSWVSQSVLKRNSLACTQCIVLKQHEILAGILEGG